MARITLQARPKVNLFLHVTGKRDDGYHLLDSLVVFPDGINDTLTFDDGDYFTLRGEFAPLLTGDDQDNLVLRAVRAFPGQKGMSIRLDKDIPPGAGLGGGSSDAAMTIRALEQIHGALPSTDRDRILLSLGADVPVCYEGTPSRFKGIGDVITPAPPLPPFHIVLAWPGVPSFTKDVFAAYDKNYSAPLGDLPDFQTQDDFLEFLKSTRNDLGPAAEKTCAPIADARTIMNAQSGCALARMTGSGSCVFGLFKEKGDAQNARTNLSIHNPSWWVRAGEI